MNSDCSVMLVFANNVLFLALPIYLCPVHMVPWQEGQSNSEWVLGYSMCFLAIEIMTKCVITYFYRKNQHYCRSACPSWHLCGLFSTPQMHSLPLINYPSLWCVTENRDKRRQLRWQQRWSIASLKTETTDVKRCRPLLPASLLPVSINQCRISAHKASLCWACGWRCIYGGAVLKKLFAWIMLGGRKCHVRFVWLCVTSQKPAYMIELTEK